MAEIIPVEGIDRGGIVIDSPSINLPPNTFSDANNVRFNDGAIRKFLGHIKIFDDTDFTNILAIDYWESPIGSAYVIAHRDSDDTEYVSLVTLDNMGQADVYQFTPQFTFGGNWQFTTFNGGYSFIVNNGIDTPKHITSQQGQNFADLTLVDLPGWAGYNNGDTDVNAVSAGIVISAGNSLIAGDLVERDNNGNIVRELRGVVRSSDVAAVGNIPQNWNPFQNGANTADELLLADTGFISALVSLQGKVFAFTESSIHQVEITTNGLRTIPITFQYGALGQGAVFEFDGRMIIVGSSDIYEFSGHPASIQSIADGRVRRYLFDKLNPVHTRIFMERNLKFDEMWIGFANLESTDGSANEALVFNYRDNTWTRRDLPNAVSMTTGAIPGGGIAGSLIQLNAPTDTDETGQFGVCDKGTRATQELNFPGHALAAHDGIEQQITFDFESPSEPVQFLQREEFDLEVNNTATMTAQPSLVHAVIEIELPNVTYNNNTAISGGSRFEASGTNVPNITIETSAMRTVGVLTVAAGTDLNRGTYLDSIIAYINGDYVPGFSDVTASKNVGNDTLILTSDVMGIRDFEFASITNYTGTVVPINNLSPDAGITLTRTETTSTFEGNSASGTGETGNAGGTGISITRTTSGSSGQTVVANPNCPDQNWGGSGNYGWSVPAGSVYSASCSGTGYGGPYGSGLIGPASGTCNLGAGGMESICFSLVVSWSPGTVLTYKNNNTHPVTLTATGIGTTTLQPGQSVSSSTLSNQNWTVSFPAGTQTSYDWKATNDRAEGLQEDVFNLVVTVGSDTLNFGDLPHGDSATLNTTDSATTATWTANVFDLSQESFNQDTADADTTVVGPITFTRTTNPPIVIPDGVTLSGSRNFYSNSSTPSWQIPEVNHGSVAIPGGELQLVSRSGAWRGSGGTSSQGNTITYFVLTNTANYDVTYDNDIADTGIYTWSLRFERGGTGNIRPEDRGIPLDPLANSLGYTNTNRVIAANSRKIIAVASRFTGSGGPNFIQQPDGDYITNRLYPGVNVSLYNITGTSQTYDYSARLSGAGAATLEYADGLLTPSIELTPTDQQILDDSFKSVINVRGEYDAVSGTSESVGTLEPMTTTVGNGVYGYPDEDAPAVSLRLTHIGEFAEFNIRLKPFEPDDDTTMEYKDFLLEELADYLEFQGLNPYTTPRDEQPEGSVFYIEQSPDNPDAVRFINIDSEDHDPIVIEAVTFLDTEYPETTFGGDITESLTTITDGASGDPAPTVRYTHPYSGSTDIIYFGRYETDTDIAEVFNRVFQGVSGWVPVREGGSVVLTKDVADTDRTIFTQEVPEGQEFITATISQTRAGVLPDNQPPIFVVTSPEGDSFTVDLLGYGTENGIITDSEINVAIWEAFNNSGNANLFNLWTVDTDDDSHVLFRSTFDIRNLQSNGVNADGVKRLPDVPLNPQVTPGFDTDYLGRELDTDTPWSYSVVTYGGTGTTPDIFPMDSEWANTRVGVNPRFSQSGYFYIQFGDLVDVTVQLDTETVNSAGETIFNAVRTLDAFRATYNTTTDVVEILAVDYSAALRAQVLTVETTGGTLLSNCSDSLVVITDTTTNMNDSERPWTISSFNTSRKFVVVASDEYIYATDLSKQFDSEDFEAYIERKRLHIQPTKDVESVTGILLDRVQGDTDLYVRIGVTNKPGEDLDLTNPDDYTEYEQMIDDYKADVRKTGRYLNTRIGVTKGDVIIEGISFEIGKRGER